MFCFFFFFVVVFLFFVVVVVFEKNNTGTRIKISLDFTAVMSFDLLCKRNNNKDDFYCKV